MLRRIDNIISAINEKWSRLVNQSHISRNFCGKKSQSVVGKPTHTQLIAIGIVRLRLELVGVLYFSLGWIVTLVHPLSYYKCNAKFLSSFYHFLYWYATKVVPKM